MSRSWPVALVLAFAALSLRAQTPLPETSVAAFVSDLRATIPGVGSEAFLAPSASEAQTFRDAMYDLLNADPAAATTKLNSLNYDLRTISDPVGMTWYVALERSTGFRGLGTYLIQPSFARDITVEVPHPLFDTNTELEGAALLTGLGAKALFIAGTHRCADAAYSACSGTTAACTGAAAEAFRISDAGHFTTTFFQAAHEAVLADSANIQISLHGNSSEVPDVEISDGTKISATSAALPNVIRDTLVANAVVAASCNWTADNPAVLNLCGTTNVQGRLSNASPDVCAQSAASSSGQFLHIEQHIGIRNTPAPLIDAIGTALPLVKGDANGDRAVTIADVFYLVNFLFVSGPQPWDGDDNGDHGVTIADVFYLVNFLFTSGPSPV